MAVNHVIRRQAPSGVLKNVCSEQRLWKYYFCSAFTAEGLNGPYGSKALKEQLIKRRPLDACSDDSFWQVYFYYF